MVSSYLVTAVSELGILRFRPCIGGRGALLRSTRCVGVDWNKGQMAAPTTQKLQSFHNAWYTIWRAVPLTTPAWPTTRERRGFGKDNLKYWVQLNMHTYIACLLLEVLVNQSPT